MAAVLIAAAAAGSAAGLLPEPLAQGGARPAPTTVPFGNWTELNVTPDPENSIVPGAQVHSSMAYSPDADMFLLVPGLAASGQVWGFNVAAGVWNALPTGTVSPGRLAQASLVYDSAVRRFVLFGGYTPYSGSPLGHAETWLYDPAAQTWTNATPATSPSARYGAATAYVPGAAKVVLFGGVHVTCNGSCGNGSYAWILNDTWVYDAAANTWTNVTPPGSPGRVLFPSMVYDPTAGKALLITGFPGSPWLFDPGSDTWQMVAGFSGPMLDDPSVAYDAAVGSVVTYGGYGGEEGALVDDTSWFNVTTFAWSNVSVASAPSPRHGAAMAYDSKAGVLLLYGGADASGPLTDTWRFQAATPGPLSLAVSFQPPSGDAPLNVTFVAQPRGGAPPYSFLWDFGDGLREGNAAPEHTYASSGVYHVRAVVVDALNSTAATTVEVSVGPLLPGWLDGLSGSDLTILLGLTAAAGIAAGVVAGTVIWRRRARVKPPSTTDVSRHPKGGP